MPTVIGSSKEVKDYEHRIAMQPNGVWELVHHGQRVIVQPAADLGASFADSEYEAADAKLADSAAREAAESGLQKLILVERRVL